MLFEKLVEQHRVHRFVAHGVDFPLGVAHHQIGVDLFHILSHQAKLWAAHGINLLLVAEGDRFQREERFAGLLHWLNFLFKSPGRSSGAEPATWTNENGSSSNRGCTEDIADEAVVAEVSTTGADSNNVIGRGNAAAGT